MTLTEDASIHLLEYNALTRSKTLAVQGASLALVHTLCWHQHIMIEHAQQTASLAYTLAPVALERGRNVPGQPGCPRARHWQNCYPAHSAQ